MACERCQHIHKTVRLPCPCPCHETDFPLKADRTPTIVYLDKDGTFT